VPLSSYEAVDSLIREILEKQPMHPGAHHLRIHLWNHKDDRRALKSAALCGQTGPVAAHLWHMPGHTFTGLKRFADAAWQQEAAARADHAWMEAYRLLPDEIHNYAHNNDWLVENLGFLGRVREAQVLAKNMIELPRLAPKSHVIGRGRVEEERSSHAMGARRLLGMLVDFELWEALLELRGTPYLHEREEVVDEARRLCALVWALSELGRKEEADLNMTRLQGLSKRVRSERLEAAEHAEQEARKAAKPTAEADAVRAAADVLGAQWNRVEKVDALVAEGRLAVALASDQKDEAGAQLVAAKQLSKVRRAAVQARLGQGAEALKLAREAASAQDAVVLPVASLVWHLWQQGVRAEALQWFEKLRKVAGAADAGLPALERLGQVAREAGLSGEWRQPADSATDVGVRPSLDELGPFRWRPRKAPLFHLESDRGGTTELAALKGKPILLVFYLGSGCVHCIEQLNLLAPLAERFRQAGIDIYAISTESMEDLPKTTDQSKTGAGFPFPLLADPSLAAFRMYRAYDDFEQQAMHGLFLIDGSGNLRWQNISRRPFSQLEWLLKESQRLLVLPGS
jgi:peroxiredoxin